MGKCMPGCKCKRHAGRGQKRDPAIGAKISAAKMGHSVSEETRAKIGAAGRGRVQPAEAVERRRAARTQHGYGARGALRSPEYRSWDGMRQRCGNPHNIRYADYGGRGIRVCERWASFANFVADMGDKPEPKSQYSIDRVNNDGDYTPENCRWADRSTQMKNRPNFNPDKRSKWRHLKTTAQ